MPGPKCERALGDLRIILLAGLKAALNRWVRTSGREFEELAEDFVQDALVQIIGKIDTFRNLSRFTTWAHKICIRIALTELRRKRWKDCSLDVLMEKGQSLPEIRLTGPEESSMSRMGMEWIQKMMGEELSERQMAALLVVVIKGLPLEEAARLLGTNRNALYKTIHDARLKLKARMMKEGLSLSDISN